MHIYGDLKVPKRQEVTVTIPLLQKHFSTREHGWSIFCSHWSYFFGQEVKNLGLSELSKLKSSLVDHHLSLSAEDDEEVMIRFVCLKSGRVFYSSGTIWPWSRFLAQFRIYVLPLIVVLTIRHLVLDVAWCFILKEATTLTKRISLSHSYNRHLVSLFRRQYKVHCVSVKNLS